MIFPITKPNRNGLNQCTSQKPPQPQNLAHAPVQTASVANPLPQMHAYKTQLVPVGMTRVDETVQFFTIMSWVC